MRSPLPWWRRRPGVTAAGLIAAALALGLIAAALGVTAAVRVPALGTRCTATTAVAEASPSLVAIGSSTAPRTASGTMIRSNGVILTAAGAVSGLNGPVVVTLSNGTVETAEIVGTDAATMLTVLKVGGQQRPFLLPSPRERLMAGKPVVVIGSELAEASGTLSGTVQSIGVGVDVAAPQGRLGDAVVVDVPATVGNLGAPVLDCEYRMVGVVVGSLTDGTAAVVSADAAQRVVARLLGLG